MKQIRNDMVAWKTPKLKHKDIYYGIFHATRKENDKTMIFHDIIE
jgi:hypothetical protein